MRIIEVPLTPEDEARLVRILANVNRPINELPGLDVPEERVLLMGLEQLADKVEHQEARCYPEDRPPGTVEIAISADQARMLARDQVHQHALDHRARWLAHDFIHSHHTALISQVLETDEDLATALTPRALPGGRYGIVVDDALRVRLCDALRQTWET